MQCMGLSIKFARQKCSFQSFFCGYMPNNASWHPWIVDRPPSIYKSQRTACYHLKNGLSIDQTRWLEKAIIRTDFIQIDPCITIGITCPTCEAGSASCRVIHAADPDFEFDTATFEKRATEAIHGSMATIGSNGIHSSFDSLIPLKC